MGSNGFELKVCVCVYYTLNHYLLKNPKRGKTKTNPYITLNKEELFCFFGVLKQLVVSRLRPSFMNPTGPAKALGWNPEEPKTAPHVPSSPKKGC